MTVRLFNSAMMPQEGIYHCNQITVEQFTKEVQAAWPNLISSIGYAQTASLISKLTGIYIQTNRDNSQLHDGDIILAVRLKNRITDPATKGRQRLGINDVEFFKIMYYDKEH